jgi:endonuclease G
MARKTSAPRRIPSSFRRTKAFLVANLILWGALGGWYLFQTPARQDEVARLVGNAIGGRKQVTAFDVVWDLWQLYYSRDYVAAVAPGDTTHVYGGAPRTRLGANPERRLINRGYALGYSDELGSPLWAAYRVRDSEPAAAPERPDRFVVDRRTGARVEPGWYSGSGFDRGHLAPNHVIATRYGPQAQEETFLMSNIIPQKHGLNAGPWKQLEQRISTRYPGRFGEVWVLAGPVFGAAPPRLRGRIAIPEACYMIIVDESDGRVRASAYLFPQDVAENATLGEFITSIDEIERRTGLDFLAELADPAEAALEARKIERVW